MLSRLRDVASTNLVVDGVFLISKIHASNTVVKLTSAHMMIGRFVFYAALSADMKFTAVRVFMPL